MTPRPRSGPIFVTGAHRSGTTWVGRMLCASGETAYIHEPFNVAIEDGWPARPLPHWYLYVNAENEHAYTPLLDPVFDLRYELAGRPLLLRDPRRVARVGRGALQSLVHRVRGRRPLVKDPLALFSTEWIVQRFGATPVIMIRHPAAFASSIKRLEWHFDVHNWLEQPLLLRDHLQAFEGEIRNHARRRSDLIDQAGLMWRVLYSFVAELRSRHPEWIFVRHEDLAADPEAGFADLYGRLGLVFDERARRVVERSSTGSGEDVAPGELGSVERDSRATRHVWTTRLETDEVERLRKAVGDVAAMFYEGSSWAPT